MAREYPQLPEISWLELEILNRLISKERYGNELLMLLTETLGNETITSGKLYPNFKKMEKAGLIKRLKKQKDDIPDELRSPGVLTRGVDRIYFEITDKGIDEVEKAERFIANIQFNRMLFYLDTLVAERFKEILTRQKGETSIGLITGSDSFSIIRSLKIVPKIEGKKFFLLMMEEKTEEEQPDLKELLDREMAYFPSKLDDIPLKNDYMDVMVSTIDLSKIKKMKQYLAEVIRTVKPGGWVIIVEYAKFNSYILERIFSQNLYPGDKKTFTGYSVNEVAKMMEDKLESVTIERIKEQFIVMARKK